MRVRSRFVEVVKVIPKKLGQERMAQQILDFPVPQIVQDMAKIQGHIADAVKKISRFIDICDEKRQR